MFFIETTILLFVLWGVFRLTKASQFPYASFLYVFAYATHIYFGLVCMKHDAQIEKNEIFLTMTYLISLGFMSIICAYLTHYFIIDKPDIKKLIIRPLSQNKLIALILTAIITISIASLYLFKVETNAFLVIFSDSSLLEKARESATYKIDNYAIYSIFIFYFLPIIWLVLYIEGYMVWPTMLFIFNTYLSLSTGQKSPIVYNIIMLILAIAIKNRRFSYSRAFKYGGIVFCAIFALIYAQNRHLFASVSSESLGIVLSGLKNRVLYGGNLSLLDHVYVYPQLEQHFYFQSPLIPPATSVQNVLYSGLDLIGSSNTSSLGGLYAAFGNNLFVYAGIYLISLAVFISDGMFFNRIRTSVGAAIYVVFCLAVIRLAISDWKDVFSPLVFYGFAFLGCFYLCEAAVNALLIHRGFVISGRRLTVMTSLFLFIYFLINQIRSLA